jgi:hypothetical protein
MTRTKFITHLVISISLTLSLEVIGLPQPITGPLVNMMLILTTLILNPPAGIILGCISPLVAVMRGQLPAILLPMVPFIAIGNALLVLIFGTLRKKYHSAKQPLVSPINWIALLSGSTIKFLWLYGAARIVLPIFLGVHLAPNFVAMMALPQFITAVIGSTLALAIYQMLINRI